MRFILVEGIEDSRKYYPNISDEDFNRIIRLDPTTNIQRDKLGSYSKWLLTLFQKGKLDNEEHVTDLLNRFESEKNHLVNKDIMRYKSLEEVDAMLNDENSYKNLTDRQKLRQTQTAVKKTNVNNDAELVYEDSKWQVWVPKTYEASCKLGQGSRWCTASTANKYYYDYYTKSGNLYININKQDPTEKYQFHFESNSFMDADDRGIDLTEFLSKDKSLRDFYLNKVDSLTLNTFIELLGSDAFEMQYRERLMQLSKNIDEDTDLVMIYDKLGDSLFDETKFGFILQNYIDYLFISENNFTQSGYTLYKVIKKYNEDDTPFYIVAKSTGTKFEKSSYKTYLVNKMMNQYKDVKNMLSIDYSTIADVVSNRDMSKEFIEHCFENNLWEYWDGADFYVENWEDLLDYINESNKEKLRKLGVEPTEESIIESPISDDIIIVIKSAAEDAERDGAIDDAMSDFEKSWLDSLPDGVVAYLPHKHESDNSDVLISLNSAGGSYIDSNYMNILYVADDSDGFIDALSESIVRYIEENFKFNEPYYGWQGFSEDTFNDSLDYLLDEIEA